ncbi:MAG: Various polyols ABC transporter, permease protein, partial [uncultured Blastococcus sp.]
AVRHPGLRAGCAVLRPGRAGPRRDARHRTGPGAAPSFGRAVGPVAHLAARPGGPRADRSRGRRLVPEPGPRGRLDVRLLRRPRDRDAVRPDPHPLGPLGLRRRRQRGGRPAGRHQRAPRVHERLRRGLHPRRGRRHPGRRPARLGQHLQWHRRRQPQRHRRGRHRRHEPVRRTRQRLLRAAGHHRHPVHLQRADAAQPLVLLPLHDHRPGARAGGRRRLPGPQVARLPRTGV